MIKIIAAIATTIIASWLSAKTTPNVLIFLIDDLGWTDLSVNGSEFFETPNIDALAKSGVNFKASYSANPVCSPTRAALMTGKAPQRVGITQWISGSKVNLALSEITLAEAFKEAGYRTGYIGKWHLGKTNEAQPEYQGFDSAVAVNRAGQPASFFSPFGKGQRASNVPDLSPSKKNDYLTDALTDKALEFIGRKKETPFFLCLSHYAVHTPIQAPKKLVAKYQTKKKNLYGDRKAPKKEELYHTLATTRQDDPTYAAMIENLDWNIGRVLDHLDSHHLREETIILFTSDNGGLSHRKREGGPTCNLPLRSGKGWMFEGGIRIPTMISWPGEIPPAQSNTPVITMDMYPTLLSLSGLPAKPEQHLDGLSLLPLLKGGDPGDLANRFLAWTYPHKHGSGHLPSDAIQKDGWKLIKYHAGPKFELYHLAEEIGEITDLSKKHPEKITHLNHLLETWIHETTPRED